jgi:exosortase A
MADVTIDENGIVTAPSAHVRKAQRLASIALCLGIAGLVALFWPTVLTAVQLWDSSSSYTHAYLIAPVSAYLIWLERETLHHMPIRPSLLGVAVIGLFATAWLFADLLGINEGRHFAFVGMLQGLFLTVLGVRAYWHLFFPLNYLWLMVPAGEFLVAPLQTISHVGATQLLLLSGISVYTEGLLIQVPDGSFLVEAGCAGLNFLLTALALSLVYGRLVYQTTWARVVCVVVALAVSVAANIVRIYLIIALTEWTDQKLDIAADHLVFGWGFFSVVMLALMWIGARVSVPPLGPQQSVAPVTQLSAVPSAIPIVLACGLALAALAPGISAALMNSEAGNVTRITLPHNVAQWHRGDATATDWRPTIVPPDASIAASYVAADAPRIDLVAAVYAVQRQGREAAAAGNQPIGDGWHQTAVTTLTLPRGEIAVTHLRRGEDRRIAASWYEGHNCTSASRLRTKLCTLRARLTGGSTAGSFVVLSTDAGTDVAETERALAAFAQELPMFVTDETTPIDP